MAQPILSVVHDYSILYSNRIIQKDKRWADGRLRFYELNNKLEVYSEEQFLIATDFYPSTKKLPLQTGAFEEGTEYKLPSGKFLLSLQEYLGCSMRDVSKVFKKASSKTPEANGKIVPTTYIKQEGSMGDCPVQAQGNVLEVPEDLTFLKAEPTEPKVASPLAPPKPGRIGLTRKKGSLKKQGDLSQFTRGPSVETRLRQYVQRGQPRVNRIPPRSANLYTRLYKELSMEDEENELDSSVKVPHTGLTQSKKEDTVPGAL